VEGSPSRVPEWPLSSSLQCVWSGVVMLKNHSMSSTRAFLLDCFVQTAKLLTVAFSSDGQVPIKQFIIENPTIYYQIPPERGVSLMSKLPCLKRANHFLAVLSAMESSP
jgi:hypothetical protein